MLNKLDQTVELESGVKFAMIRRDPSAMFLDIPAWLNKLQMKELISHDQSESNGNITISVFYK